MLGLHFLGVLKGRSRVDVMVGLEYYGFSETTIAVEIAERHLFNHNDIIRAFPNSTREDSVEWTLRYTADWLNAKLSTTVLLSAFGYKFQDGFVVRAQGEYELSDALTFTGGILVFEDGNLPPLDTWYRNDRLFFDLKYSV